MVLGRLVPWQSWAEWEKCRSGLFSGRPQDVGIALNQVQAWRCRGRLPLGIDATASLLDVTHRDPGYTSNLRAVPSVTPAGVEMQLRLHYAMVIVRLVNGISDSAQKGRVASSVAALATEAGLPRLLVDVRHEAAHNELPSLSVLRLAAEGALKWLKGFYWDRQAHCLRATQERVTTLLKEYVAQRRVAVGKSFTAPAATAEEEDPTDDIYGLSQPGYNAAESQKQRRAVIGELKELVHSTATQLIAKPILDEGALDPVPRGGLRGEAVNKPEEALRDSVLIVLTSWLPGLHSAILSGAVDRIARADCAASQPDGSSTLGEELLQRCLAWVDSLLRQPTLGKSARAIPEPPAASAATSWQPSVAQVRALLAQCLAAPAIGSERTPKQQAATSKLEQLLTTFLQKQASSPNQTAAASGSKAALLAAEAVTGSSRSPIGVRQDDAQGQEASGGTLEVEQQQQAAQSEVEAQLADLQRAVRTKRARLADESSTGSASR